MSSSNDQDKSSNDKDKSPRLTLKQLKQELREYGITDLSHCVEREDLEAELRKAIDEGRQK